MYYLDRWLHDWLSQRLKSTCFEFFSNGAAPKRDWGVILAKTSKPLILALKNKKMSDFPRNWTFSNFKALCIHTSMPIRQFRRPDGSTVASARPINSSSQDHGSILSTVYSIFWLHCRRSSSSRYYYWMSCYNGLLGLASHGFCFYWILLLAGWRT